jgi:aryl-alcohol dehydrogenase-like predicted oxidoreductase
MQRRRLGRLGHESSVLIYGGAMLAEVDQDTADESMQLALDSGINHFDTAAGYGDAELRMGPWMPRIRNQIFLATKTQLRTAEEAWAQINASLERLQTDHLDLIQLHAIGDLDELDKATGTGGSLESAIRARDEGLVSAIGITGHGHQAPATHLEGLRRFPFDSVLTPWNYALSKRADYAADWATLAEETQRRDVGLMTIKTVARQNWPDENKKRYSTWYEPLDDQERISAALAFVLSHQQITGIPTAGDVHLLPLLVQAEKDSAGISREDAAAVLDKEADYSSPFLSMAI